MRNFLLLLTLFSGVRMAHAGKAAVAYAGKAAGFALAADSAVEPWTYTEDFENGLLGAWASYPLWQDLAYDQNFRINKMVPGDDNVSLVEKVTPYTSVDNYAGAQKLLDMCLVPGSTIRFRYYLKTSERAGFFKVRLAAGISGALDFTIADPEVNKWVWVTVSFDDFVRQNPSIAGKGMIRVYALAYLACIPHADPAMPIYLGLDDITFKGARPTAFKFVQPLMYKLPEFAAYIPRSSYQQGESFSLSGTWPAEVTHITLELASYMDSSKVIYRAALSRRGDRWVLPSLKLDYPDGLYIGHLRGDRKDARAGSREDATAGGREEAASRYSGDVAPGYSTFFTFRIAPGDIAGRHPRLLFDADTQKWIARRLKEGRFSGVDSEIVNTAQLLRRQVAADSLVYDLDQFPDEDWLATSAAWKSHFLVTSDPLWWNSLAYTFHKDTAAGEYVKKILLTLSGWPDWGHPWQSKRGRFSEHNTGTWSYRVAEAYDLIYDLLTPDERTKVRGAILKNIVGAVDKTYILDNNVTGNTSNWLAATVGGSLMNMAAIGGDGPETAEMEPYLTGALMKFYNFITNVTDSRDGAWGEGLGYNSYSFHNMSQSVPALKNVYNIDMSNRLAGSYNEFIWASNLEKKEFYNFGDAHLGLAPFTNWAFLLDMQKDPRLAWLYNYTKQTETLDDVFYETKNVKQQAPFAENPDHFFHELGTTVFKSGWGKDDLSFVMRTGAFYNHQHMDQGSFWFSDHGITFIGEREGSTYYDDALYQPWFIQPVAHSTILINGNHQSQRIGDERTFAPGFDDHAYLSQSLDGRTAAFSSGDIGRLYWGKVKSLVRNVLFLKPRTILLLDVAIPGVKDVDVTSLYQSSTLGGIQAGKHLSTITKQGFDLSIFHLSPEGPDVRAVETPHYLYTLINKRPLTKEGMLTVTARTAGAPLVMANLLTSTTAGVAADVSSAVKEGCVAGVASGKKFAFNTKPGSRYSVEGMTTDALAVTWTGDAVFAALATTLGKNGVQLIECSVPATFELDGDRLRYDCDKPCTFIIHAGASAGLKKDLVVDRDKGEGVISLVAGK